METYEVYLAGKEDQEPLFRARTFARAKKMCQTHYQMPLTFVTDDKGKTTVYKKEKLVATIY